MSPTPNPLPTGRPSAGGEALLDPSDVVFLLHHQAGLFQTVKDGGHQIKRRLARSGSLSPVDPARSLVGHGSGTRRWAACLAAFACKSRR